MFTGGYTMRDKEKIISGYEDVEYLAYCYAISRTYNYNAAKSIAALTAGAFILQDPQGSYKELRSWVFSTAKHHCSHYFRQQKKADKIARELKLKMMTTFTPASLERDEDLHLAYNEALLSLSDEQFVTIFLYYNCLCNYQIIHEIMGVSINALRMRISRIHKRITALTNLNMGMLYTKKIVTPELNDVLYKFLKRFRKHLENDTLHKMYYYFSKADMKNYNESIRIKNIRKYEIVLVNDEYNILVVYLNKNDEIETFDFKFKIENNHLKITKPPRKRPDAYIFKKDSDQARKLKELLRLYPPDRTGKSTIPKELIDALIKKKSTE